jgi:hypothetical protein
VRSCQGGMCICLEVRGRVTVDSAMSAELWWRDGVDLGILDMLCGVLARCTNSTMHLTCFVAQLHC